MINKRPNTPQKFNKQTGWTFWSMFFVLGVILLFSYVGFQLVPVYSANENVLNAMERSLDDVDLRTVNRAAIVRKMDSQLYLDGSHELINYRNDLKVKRSRKQFILQTTYQREVPMFFNLFLVAKFDNKIEKDL